MLARIFWILCGIVAIGMATFQATRPKLPAERTLTHQDGRSIEASILARNADQVQIEVRGTGLRYNFPIDDLSKPDQRFLWRLWWYRYDPLPEIIIPQEALARMGLPARVESRLREIERLSERIEDTEKELKTGSSISPAWKEETERKLQRDKAEIKELKDELEEIASDENAAVRASILKAIGRSDS